MFVGMIVAATLLLFYFVNFNLFSILLSLYLAILSLYVFLFIHSHREVLKNNMHRDILTNVTVFTMVLSVLIVILSVGFYNSEYSLLRYMKAV